MHRRDFLKYTGVLGAASMLPATRLFAAHDGYTGPLYLLIDANGGWDPTSFCDPKGYVPGQTTPRINNYPSSSIKQIGNISYAPPPDSFLGNSSLYSLQTFFQTYYRDLLVINGIDTGTNSHSDGERVSWSGELSKGGYPNFGAIVAGTLAPERSLSFLVNGGYNHTSDLVIPIRVDYEGLDVLLEVSYPNRTSPSSSSSSQYTSTQVANLIKTANQQRTVSLLNNQRLPIIQDAISKLSSTRSNENHLPDLANLLETTAEKPLSYFNGRTKAQSLYRQGRLALAAFEVGVTASAHLSLSSFDSHSNHDRDHYPMLADFFQGVDAILKEAQERGLRDRLVVVMGSDFGRTNKYNADDGKDHWPITSMMFMGNSRQVIRGNRVIGATTDRHKAIKVDRNTLAADPNNVNANAVKLTPAHIHRALRKLAGVDQSAASLSFGLGGEDLDLFS